MPSPQPCLVLTRTHCLLQESTWLQVLEKAGMCARAISIWKGSDYLQTAGTATAMLDAAVQAADAEAAMSVWDVIKTKQLEVQEEMCAELMEMLSGVKDKRHSPLLLHVSAPPTCLSMTHHEHDRIGLDTAYGQMHICGMCTSRSHLQTGGCVCMWVATTSNPGLRPTSQGSNDRVCRHVGTLYSCLDMSRMNMYVVRRTHFSFPASS